MTITANYRTVTAAKTTECCLCGCAWGRGERVLRMDNGANYCDIECKRDDDTAAALADAGDHAGFNAMIDSIRNR